MIRSIAPRLLVLLLAASPVLAQPGATGPVLTLEEAQRLARQHNPELQQVLNNMRGANASVRSAYGAFLPSASASFSNQYQQQGRQVFSGAELGASSDVIQSSYSISLSYRLSPSTFIGPRLSSANRDAVEADIAGVTEQVRALIAQQYLGVLQAQARATLQDTLVASAQAQLAFAQARAGAGATTVMEVRRAEVAVGQAQVAALQAHNGAAVELLRLFQRMGVPQPAGVRLTSTFPITSPTMSLDSMISLAEWRNPGLEGLRSREEAASLNVKRARGEYLPSLSISTGIGGYTYQYRDSEYLVQRGRSSALAQRMSCYAQDSLRVGAGMPSISSQCNQIDFTEATAQSIRTGNSQYPFDFTSSPRSISASVSIPIFDGFGREQRVAEATSSRLNAQHAVRARSLQLTGDVTAAYLTLTTSLAAVELQEQNSAKAREELAFVQERYRVGAATVIELTDSRAQFERAESDRINAVYEVHKAFAALESAVGRPLR